jgi:hypothetical protein
MLTAKKATRKTEGKNEATDVLKAEPKVRLNLDIEKSTMKKLKSRAVEEEITVSEIVRDLVYEYLSK